MKIFCPKCGSDQLIGNKKGFSGKKALVGGLLAGEIGILAGTIGSNEIEITCLACGNKFKPGEGKSENKDYTNPDILVENVKSPSYNLDIEVVDILRQSGISKAIEFVSKKNNISRDSARGYIDDLIHRFSVTVAKENVAGGCGGTIILIAIIILIAMVMIYQFTCNKDIKLERETITTDTSKSITIVPIENKYSKEFSGEWTLSSNFPEEYEYITLRNIITNNEIFGLSDFYNAKKSKYFSKDKRFLLTCKNENGLWDYYIINTKTKSVKKVKNDDNSFVPPNY